MEDVRFDGMTRALGSLLDRRTTARAAAGGALAGLGFVAGHDVDAKKKKKKCKGGKKKCGKKCCAVGLSCVGGKCQFACNASNSACVRQDGPIALCSTAGPSDCFCVARASGGFACANITDVECPAVSECATDAECDLGEVCIKTNGPDCCAGDGAVGACVQECEIAP